MFASVISGIFHLFKNIFNLSLQTRVFQNGMKIAQVSPIFEKDEEFLFTNLRPISCETKCFHVSPNYWTG